MTTRLRPRGPRGLLALVAASLLSLAGCAEAPPPSAARVPTSIVLISLDTLRPDRLSAYGYPRATSPALDRLATESVLFVNARSQSTATLTSHLSLFTSLYPAHFRITRDDGENFDMFRTRLGLPEEVVTLAETLRQAGYETAAFTGGGFVAARYGFAQGFDRYDENRSRFQGLGTTIPRIARWLESRDSARPLFLFVHTYDPHEPYRAPGPVGRRFSAGTFEELAEQLQMAPTPPLLNPKLAELDASVTDEVSDLYDNGVLYTDYLVESLLGLLRWHGLYDEATLVVLSDHGEEFLDHDRLGHGGAMYDALVRVPLIVRLPGGEEAGRLVTEPVALLDVAPTLVEIAGAPVPEQFRGLSLSPLLAGEHDPELEARPLLLDVPTKGGGITGMVAGNWKIVERGAKGTKELYDLAADPAERTDRSADEPERLKRLSAERARLERDALGEGEEHGWLARPREGGEVMSPEVLEQLRALGYVD